MPAAAVPDVVDLAYVERGSLVESRHLGMAVVTAPDGTVLRELGDAGAAVFGRSSLKLFQAVAVMRAGVALSGEQAVLATASHAGTTEHVRVVRDMLARGGFGDDDLGCPAEWPIDRAAMLEARDAGHAERRVTMNCSGKHAAFLLACQANGWSTTGYLEPMHPLQQHVRATIEELTGETASAVAVDGCGAPVFATSLVGLARGTGRVAAAGTAAAADTQKRDVDAAALAAAIIEHPWAIDGPGRGNTVLVDTLGIVAKWGAEGVMVAGTADGTAVAVKIVDGSHRASILVAVELLVSVGAVDRAAADDVIAAVTPPVLGGGRPAGRVRAAPAVLAGATSTAH